MKSPPKEEGRTDDAARLETACTATLAQQLKEINSAATKIWTDEGWRLLDQYHRTSDVRHLEAFKRHVAGIRTRLREAASQ
jgi:hypothetical protein